MKKIILLITLSLFTFATDLNSICENMVNKKEGYGQSENISFYQKDDTTYVYGLEKSTYAFIKIFSKTQDLLHEIRPDLNVQDLLVEENYLFVLHNGSINKYDLTSMLLVESFYIDLPIKKSYEQAKKFIKKDNIIYIAHGTHGIIKLNLDDKKTEVIIQNIEQDKGQISEATGITVVGDKLFVIYDNVTYDFSKKKRAFEGLFIAPTTDIANGKSISIKASREALHDGNLFVADGKLYSQHLHIIFEYKLENIEKLKYFWPNRRLFIFDGSILFGRASILNQTIKSCFEKYDPNTDSFSISFKNFKI